MDVLNFTDDDVSGVAPQPTSSAPLTQKQPDQNSGGAMDFSSDDVKKASSYSSIGNRDSDPRDRYVDSVSKWSKFYGVDKSLLSGSLKQESGYNPNAVSKTGVGNIGQVTTGTARDIAESVGDSDVDGMSDDELRNYLVKNPDKAIQYSAVYHKQLSDKFGGDTKKISAAYNAGPDPVEAASIKYGPDWQNHLGEFIDDKEKVKEVTNHIAQVEKYRSEYEKKDSSSSPEQNIDFEIVGATKDTTKDSSTNNPTKEVQGKTPDQRPDSYLTRISKIPARVAARLEGVLGSLTPYGTQMGVPQPGLMQGVSDIGKPPEQAAKEKKDLLDAGKELQDRSVKHLEKFKDVGKYKTIGEAVKNKDVSEVAKMAFIGALEFAPIAIATAAADAAGVPTPAVLAAFGLSGAEAAHQANKDRTDMTTVQKLADDVGTGVIQSVGFSLIPGVGKYVADMLPSLEHAIGKEASQYVAKSAVSNIISRFVAPAAVGGATMGVADAAQGVFDKYVSGKSPDLSVSDIISSALGQAVTGTAIGVPGAIRHGLSAKPETKVPEETPQETPQAAATKAEDSEPKSKDSLSKQAQDIISTLKDKNKDKQWAKNGITPRLLEENDLKYQTLSPDLKDAVDAELNKPKDVTPVAEEKLTDVSLKGMGKTAKQFVDEHKDDLVDAASQLDKESRDAVIDHLTLVRAAAEARQLPAPMLPSTEGQRSPIGGRAIVGRDITQIKNPENIKDTEAKVVESVPKQPEGGTTGADIASQKEFKPKVTETPLKAKEEPQTTKVTTKEESAPTKAPRPLKEKITRENGIIATERKNLKEISDGMSKGGELVSYDKSKHDSLKKKGYIEDVGGKVFMTEHGSDMLDERNVGRTHQLNENIAVNMGGEHIQDEDAFDSYLETKGTKSESTDPAASADEIASLSNNFVKSSGFKGKVMIHHPEGKDSKTVSFMKKDGTVETIKFSRNGTQAALRGNTVHIFGGLSAHEAKVALIHEIIGHHGASRALDYNLGLKSKAQSLFDKDVEGQNKIREEYKDKLAKSKEPEVELFDEWFAHNTESIYDKMYDDKGNIIEQPKDSIISKIHDIIKDYISKILGKDTSKEELERVAKDVFKKISESKDTNISKVRGTRNLNKTDKKEEKGVSSSPNLDYVKLKGANTVLDTKSNILEYIDKNVSNKDTKDAIESSASKIKKIGDDAYNKTLDIINRDIDNKVNKKSAINYGKAKLRLGLSTDDKGNISVNKGSIVDKLDEEERNSILKEVDKAREAIKKIYDINKLEDIKESKTIKKTNSKILDRLNSAGMIKDNGEGFYEITDKGLKSTEKIDSYRAILNEANGKLLSKLATSENILNIGGKPVHIDEATKNLHDTASLASASRGRFTRFLDNAMRALPYAEHALHSLDGLKHITEMLDAHEGMNYKEVGFFRKYFSKPAENARTDQAKAMVNIQEPLVGDIIRDIGFKELQAMSESLHRNDMFFNFFKKLDIKKNVKLHEVELGGKVISLSEMKLIELYRHSRSKSGLKHMTSENGGVLFDKKGKHKDQYYPTEKDLSKIAELVEGSDRMSKFNEILDKHFKNTAKLANEVSQRLFGIDVANEENYHPAQTKAGSEAKENGELGIEGMFQRVKDELNPSEFISKKENAQNPLIINGALEGAIEHVGNIAHYVGFAEPVHTIETLVNASYKLPDGKSVSLKDMMHEYDKDAEYNNIKTYLDRFEKVNSGKQSWMFKMQSAMYRNFVKSVFPYRLTTVAKQSYHVALWFTRTHPNLVEVNDFQKVLNVLKEFRAGSKAIMKLKEIEEEMRIKAPDIYEGLHTSFTDPDLWSSFDNSKVLKFFNVADKFSVDRLYKDPLNELNRIGLKPTRYVDNFSRMFSWEAAKEIARQQGLKEGTPEFDKYFINVVREGIYDQQPTSDDVSKPNLYAEKNPVIKAMLLGKSVENKGNQLTKKGFTFIKYGDKETKKKGWAMLANTMVFQPAVFTAIEIGIQTAMGKDLSKELRDPMWWAKMYALSYTKRIALIGTTLSGMIDSKILKLGGDWQESFRKSLVASGSDVQKMISSRVAGHNGDYDKYANKLLKDIEPMASVGGVPQQSLDMLRKIIMHSLGKKVK